jgi:hypothetical protein
MYELNKILTSYLNSNINMQSLFNNEIIFINNDC